MLKLNCKIYAVIILLIGCFLPCFCFAYELKLSLAELHLTSKELNWIKRNKLIKIAGPKSFPPFHYYDDQGELKGISADYIYMIMNQIGLKLEVEKNLPWPEVIDRIKLGKIDLIPCLAKTSDRKEFIDFSVPYLTFPLVILTRKDAAFIGGIGDLHGKKIAVIKKNVITDWLKRDKINFQPYYVESPFKKLESISLGNVDAGIENLAAASYIIQKYGLTNVKIAAPTPYTNYSLYMGVRKDLPELLGILNKVINWISPEEHMQIRSKWLSVRYEHGIRKKDIVEWILMLALTACMVVTVILIWNRKLKKEISERKQVLKRTEQLNRLNEKLLHPDELNKKLQLITDSIVEIFGADFSRVWMVKTGDLCGKGCPHAKFKDRWKICAHHKNCLHLMASSGRYTHTDGGHMRVPLGCFKIGKIAEGNISRLISNNVVEDTRIHDNQWARELGLVSFVGYRLLSDDGKVVGVLALFSKKIISEEENTLLENLSGTTAQIIHSSRTKEAVNKSEAKFRALFESSRDAILILDQDQVVDCNQATLDIFGCRSVEALIGREPSDFSPPFQPSGTDSRTAALKQTEKAFLNGSCHFEWIHKRLNGDEFPAEIMLSKVEVQGRIMLQALIRDITKRKTMENDLKRLASTDPLTGADNRRSFLEKGRSELSRSHRYNHSFSFLMMDVDHFKTINDKYGHNIGDQVLKDLVSVCVKSLRNTDLFGRIGGEEFAIILQETKLETAIEIGERLRKELSEARIKTEKNEIQFTVSLGLAILEKETDSLEKIMNRADKALYDAKTAGRNRLEASLKNWT